MATFFEREGKDSLAQTFKITDSLAKIAYLSDIFSHLNELNLQMQEGNKFFHDLVDKLYFFKGNLELMKTAATESDFSPFTNLTALLRESRSNGDFPFIVDHLTVLLEGFSKYFILPDPKSFDWLRDPINSPPPESFNFEEKKNNYWPLLLIWVAD